MGVRIGVVAFQGDVAEHGEAFAKALSASGRCGEIVPVRRPEDLQGLDALVIPGGESTTISRLIDKCKLFSPLQEFEGGIFATCAGMVLAGSRVDDPRVRPLGLVDMAVTRNAFGRQKDSFEADLDVKGLASPYHAVFIRAPVATWIGPDADVLARIPQGVVAVRQDRCYALAFHPEISPDLRIHGMFLDDIGVL